MTCSLIYDKDVHVSCFDGDSHRLRFCTTGPLVLPFFKMLFTQALTLFFGSSILSANAVNIVLSNDDGWAEINIREFYSSLTSAGNNVIISAPAENESGTGSSDATPTPLTDPCEFNSCPAGSPATGKNASMPRFNYVNS